MNKIWHSAQALKTAATALLLLALVVIAGVHLSGQKAVAIQGPGAMQAVGPDRILLGVNREVWLLDAAGRRLAQKPVQELGLSAAISNIAPAPDGEILLTSRGQASWVVVRSTDLASVRTITPQWPDEFKGNIARALHVAVSPDWDIAVATGGGHTVLLFDRNGQLKARTPKGSYLFTNGLWHSPEGWWTTDTNRFVLRLLDSETLAEKQSVHLQEGMGGHDFLGEMTPSMGAAQVASRQRPLATLSRLGSQMEGGYVVDVFPDGSQAAYNQEVLERLQDIGWLGENLLVVDGGNYQVLRFSAQRKALAPFGDAQVQGTLAEMRENRLFWDRLASRYLFVLGISLLLLGIAAYNRHKKLAVLAVIAERPNSTVGTPTVEMDTILKQWLWVMVWPVLVRAIVVFSCIFWLSAQILMLCTSYGVGRPWNLLLTLTLVMLPIFLAALWQQQRLQRFSLKPAYEAMLNRQAVGWLLNHSDWDPHRQDGEAPRETLVLRKAGLGGRRQWLLITNQRVLLFAASAFERRLISEWPRKAVKFAGTPEQARPRTGVLATLGRWLMPQANLLIRFNTGDVITGISPSAVTAARAARLLMMHAKPGPAGPASDRTMPETEAPRHGRRWHEVMASLALPGLGQWLQQRFTSGTIYFIAAALLFLGVVGPVLWAMSGPKMQVSGFSQWSSLYVWLLLAAISAADAYQFAGRKVRRRSAESSMPR